MSLFDPACSRLGVVYTPEKCVTCASRFTAWLDDSALYVILDGTDASKALQIKARLRELANLLLWPIVAYMEGRGDAVFRENITTFQARMDRVTAEFNRDTASGSSC